jgi:hypothetical protein
MIEIYQHFAMDTLVVDIGQKQMYGSVCISTTDNDFTVNIYDQGGGLIKQYVHDITRKLTDDEEAFVNACLCNVADTPKEVIEAFVRADNHDSFCEEYGMEYYTGLADAWGVWQDAKSYFEGKQK